MKMEQNHDISRKVFSGAIWKFAERILAQGITFIVSLIIARILDPSDYGTVSIVTVFFAFANVIISGGLNTALIQKKDADREDYNTVFTVSLLVSIAIYTILFVAAPWIAVIYKQSTLVAIIRVLGLSLPIYAIKSIVCAYVSANLKFKAFFFATLGGTLLSAVVGIYMAVNGFGAWALVAQQLTNTVVDTIILFAVTKLRLSFGIARERLRGLFGYGSRIMASSLLNVTVAQLNPVFIGLRYTSADLSFYTKGRSLPETLSSSMTYTISSVMFPALAKFQDDKEALLKYTRLYMQVVSFLVFPVMLGFFAIARNFIQIVLTEKWLSAVYYIQIVCIAAMFEVVAVGNCLTIKAMGRSDIFLRMEMLKKGGSLAILALFLLFTNTPQALAVSMLVCTALQLVVNMIPNIKLIGYKLRYQIFDLLPNLVYAGIMCIIVLLLGQIKVNTGLVLAIQILSGCGIYLLLALITKNESLKCIFALLKNRKIFGE